MKTLVERVTEMHKFCSACGSEMVFDNREDVYSPETGKRLSYSHWVCRLTVNQLKWAVENHDIVPLRLIS